MCAAFSMARPVNANHRFAIYMEQTIDLLAACEQVIAVVCPASEVGGVSFDGEILDADLSVTFERYMYLYIYMYFI